MHQLDSALMSQISLIFVQFQSKLYTNFSNFNVVFFTFCNIDILPVKLLQTSCVEEFQSNLVRDPFKAFKFSKCCAVKQKRCFKVNDYVLLCSTILYFGVDHKFSNMAMHCTKSLQHFIHSTMFKTISVLKNVTSSHLPSFIYIVPIPKLFVATSIAPYRLITRSNHPVTVTSCAISPKWHFRGLCEPIWPNKSAKCVRVVSCHHLNQCSPIVFDSCVDTTHSFLLACLRKALTRHNRVRFFHKILFVCFIGDNG